MRALGCLLVGMVACSGGDDTDPANDTDDDPVGGDYAELGFDPLAGRDPLESCENYTNSEGETFYDFEGATRYWVGEIAWDGTTATGWEIELLYPNEAWQETSELPPHCIVAFWMEAEVTDPVSCGSCELALVGTLTVDPISDCPEEYIGKSYPTVQDFTYNVRDAGGTAEVYWESGTLFATGTLTESSLSYEDDPSCIWVGEGQTQ